MPEMKCPGCGVGGNVLCSAGPFVNCARSHKFKLEYVDADPEDGGGEGDEHDRRLVCVSSPDAGCKAGDTFPVPADATF